MAATTSQRMIDELVRVLAYPGYATPADAKRAVWALLAPFGFAKLAIPLYDAVVLEIRARSMSTGPAARSGPGDQLPQVQLFGDIVKEIILQLRDAATVQKLALTNTTTRATVDELKTQGGATHRRPFAPLVFDSVPPGITAANVFAICLGDQMSLSSLWDWVTYRSPDSESPFGAEVRQLPHRLWAQAHALALQAADRWMPVYAEAVFEAYNAKSALDFLRWLTGRVWLTPEELSPPNLLSSTAVRPGSQQHPVASVGDRDIKELLLYESAFAPAGATSLGDDVFIDDHGEEGENQELLRRFAKAAAEYVAHLTILEYHSIVHYKLPRTYTSLFDRFGTEKSQPLPSTAFFDTIEEPVMLRDFDYIRRRAAANNNEGYATLLKETYNLRKLFSHPQHGPVAGPNVLHKLEPILLYTCRDLAAVVWAWFVSDLPAGEKPAFPRLHFRNNKWNNGDGAMQINQFELAHTCFQVYWRKRFGAGARFVATQQFLALPTTNANLHYAAWQNITQGNNTAYSVVLKEQEQAWFDFWRYVRFEEPGYKKIVQSYLPGAPGLLFLGFGVQFAPN